MPQTYQWPPNDLEIIKALPEENQRALLNLPVLPNNGYYGLEILPNHETKVINVCVIRYWPTDDPETLRYATC